MAIRLKRYHTNYSLISIQRNGKIDENILYGFVFGYSKNLVLILKKYDFYLDGFKIIRMEDIIKVETNETIKFQEKILKNDGDINKIRVPCKIDMHDMYTVLSDLKDKCVIVNVQIEGPKIEQFLIGSLLDVNGETIKMRHFDGTGKWVKKVFELKIKDITTIEFSTNYINRYKKYIKL